jgi:tellurite resistance protein
MGILSDLIAASTKVLNSYKGDTVFLHAAAAAAANVIAADGTIEDTEIDAAIKGMLANETLKASYTPSQIEVALTEALNHAKTRAGRMTNTRAIEAMAAKPADAKQDVFLIAADVTDGNSKNGLGADEKASLKKIADALGVDMTRLLG